MKRPTRIPVMFIMMTLLPVALAMMPAVARAEYRAYELEVVDMYDCRLNKREKCRVNRVMTALDPRQYISTHGGPYHIGVIMLATWMCRGDTSYFRAVCPRPVPNKPKFKSGDSVEVALKKHITEGWVGIIEVAYFQPSVRSNVYGVRFADRKNVYARYFEKDLAKPASGGNSADSPAANQENQAAAGTQATENSPSQ